jgi:hypothetical protein
MNGDQPAEAEKPPLEAADPASPNSNGADSLNKKRKKEALKPIITNEGDTQESETGAQQNTQDKSGCV